MPSIHQTNTLGQLIRTLRKTQGLTQAALASSAGVGVRFLRELEQGKETCHIGKVLTVLHMLGQDVVVTKRGEVK